MKDSDDLQREIRSLKIALEEQKDENNLLKKQLAETKMNQLGEEEVVSQANLWTSISHEILTPMDAILGMADLVMETDLTDEQRNYLEMINASADRLFGVVSDIIDYSELQENKLRQDMVNFDLIEVVGYDLYVAELSAKHKDLSFSYHIDQEIPNHLHGDPGRLRQVLGNLISNSIKYTEKGSVDVDVKIGGYDEKGRMLLKFSVKDSGIGLTSEMKKSIFFKPATTGVKAVGDKYSEGGLGLVVSAKLVALYGGDIGVKSKEGKGSTFWFTWPVSNPLEKYMGELPPEMVGEKQDKSLVLQGGRVLLAEDEYINASITKAFLEQAGLQVTVVSDGEEAVEIFDKNKFHAVLMDVQMPNMDGIEATRIIRQKERGRGTPSPIIALTAHAMHGDREKCLQAGMDDYLAKPLDKGQLIDMLAYYMTKKALLVGSDPQSQHEVMQLLVEKGWSVTLAETGRLAMYEASLSCFDLIIIDSSTPTQDGAETVNTIRKLEQFSGGRASIIHIGLKGAESDPDEYKGVDIDTHCSWADLGPTISLKVEQLS